MLWMAFCEFNLILVFPEVLALFRYERFCFVVVLKNQKASKLFTCYVSASRWQCSMAVDPLLW